MRSSIWMLAICAFAWGAVSAQDRVLDRSGSPFDPPGTGRTIEYFSRDGQNARQIAKSRGQTDLDASKSKEDARRLSAQAPKREAKGVLPSAVSVPSASAPKVRNYYEELFGKNGIAAQGSTARPGISGKPKSVKLLPASSAKPDRDQDAAQFEAGGMSPKPPAQERDDNPFAAFADQNVTPAKHESSQSGGSGPIQPVAATSDDNPFRAFESETDTADGTETDADEFRPDTEFTPDAAPQNQELFAADTLPAAPESARQRIDATVRGAQTPSVTVEWASQGEITVGHECQCELIVRNNGKVMAHDLAVDAWFPYSVRLLRTVPKPSATGDHVTWKFDSLAPGQDQKIQITMMPNERGSLDVTANVRFTAAASESFDVVEPLLNIVMKGPSRALVGDLVPQVITVSNPGSGTAHNVVVEVRIPEGLEHSRGSHLLTEVGSLNPGESRDLTLRMTAVAGGRQSVQVEARAGDELTQATVSDIEVVAPSLKLVADGPTLRYLGRSATYTVSAINDGTTSTNNVRILYKIPQGFKFLQADHGGQYDEAGRTVNWFVGGLSAGEKFTVSVEFMAEELGDFAHYVRTVSEQGANAEAKIETRVEGTASLVLEIVDLDDPIEVGVETGYEIRVHNDGSAVAQNIGLSCELPNGTSILDVKGPTNHIAENGVVIFKSLDELPPGKTALYRVHLRGTAAGDLRFRARLTSDSIQEPLIVEELTKFYGDGP